MSKLYSGESKLYSGFSQDRIMDLLLQSLPSYILCDDFQGHVWMCGVIVYVNIIGSDHQCIHPHIIIIHDVMYSASYANTQIIMHSNSIPLACAEHTRYNKLKPNFTWCSTHTHTRAHARTAM